MWDQVLKRIEANKTPLLAAQRWGKTIDKIHLVNEGVNLVYYFENQDQRYYLRITHRDLRPETQLLAAILPSKNSRVHLSESESQFMD